MCDNSHCYTKCHTPCHADKHTHTHTHKEENEKKIEKDNVTTCAICFEEIDTNKNVAVMDCGHTFHFKCIYQWNSTASGDTCPMCRSDLGLPDTIESDSDDSDDDSLIDFPEDDYDDGIPSNTEVILVNERITEEIIDDTVTIHQESSGYNADDEGTSSESSYRIANEVDDDDTDEPCKIIGKSLANLFINMDDAENTFNLKVCCGDCNQTLEACDFCAKPFCACAITRNKPQNRACPFNKFYNKVFDHKTRDHEMIDILEIRNPKGTDLYSPRICSVCFANRDMILKSSAITVNNEDYNLTEEILEHIEIKSIYYNLYYDNSGMNNSNLYTKYPSYPTYEEFKIYAREVLFISTEENANGDVVDLLSFVEENIGESALVNALSSLLIRESPGSETNDSQESVDRERIENSNTSHDDDNDIQTHVPIDELPSPIFMSSLFSFSSNNPRRQGIVFNTQNSLFENIDNVIDYEENIRENTLREIRNVQNQSETQQENSLAELSREAVIVSDIRRPLRRSSNENNENNENNIEMSRTGNTIIRDDNTLVRITDHNIPHPRPRRFFGNFNFPSLRNRLMSRFTMRRN